MSLSQKYISPFVCGFSAAVLSTLPGLKQITCCLIIPIAAFFSLSLDQKINKTDGQINTGKAFAFGLLTGLFAALFITFFDVIITFVTRTNDFVETLPQSVSLIRNYDMGPVVEETIKVLKMISNEIKNSGFSFLYTLAILISNLIINSIFGLIGGLLGMNYLNKKTSRGFK